MWRLARRVAAALGLAGMAATLFRFKGEGEVAPKVGGWREIPQDEFGR
jgi:hypothetical protein